MRKILITLCAAIPFLASSCNGGSNTNNTPTMPKYAYIIAPDNNGYLQCNVNSNGIESSTCTLVTPQNADLNWPVAIAISNNIAYILNNDGNSYTQCNINSSGIESDSCFGVSPNDPGALLNPSSITISNGYAYMTDYADPYGIGYGAYTQCKVNKNGIESETCLTIGNDGESGLVNPMGVITYQNLAFFTNSFENNGVTQCNVNSLGINADSCFDAQPNGTSVYDASGLAIYNNYLFISNLTHKNNDDPDSTDYGSYTRCNLNSSGIDNNSCITTSLPLTNDPHNIAFAGNYAYFVNFSVGGAGYTQCLVENNNINTDSCKRIVLNNIPTTTGIAFQY
ncbi:MAG: hypothetical protein PHC75_00325 [Burkholderiales bacterium]|nr:hypothetical protein [Burkholderiales bacterium]